MYKVFPFPSKQRGQFIADGKYQLEDKIHGDSTGAWTWRAKSVANGETVIVKMKSNADSLTYEVRTLRHLRQTVGIPKELHYSQEVGYRALVLTDCGPNLREVFHSYGKFSLKTVLMIGIQVLEGLEAIHERDFIHRDIKPANLLVGTTANPRIHIVDFETAMRYRGVVANEGLSGSKKPQIQHIPYRENRANHFGSPCFSSLNKHLGIQSSRRDDLESVLFMLAYFLHGKLPWSRINRFTCRLRGQRISASEATMNCKMTTPSSVLCKGYPFLHSFLMHVRSLHFEQAPDYAYLKGLFTKTMNEHEFEFDSQFDWIKPSPVEQKESKHVHQQQQQSIVSTPLPSGSNADEAKQENLTSICCRRSPLDSFPPFAVSSTHAYFHIL